MLAESLESRKFERKPLFDVPLPVRPKNRESSTGAPQDQEPSAPNHKMAFSLLTKKGNRQQVCIHDVGVLFLSHCSLMAHA